jgi:hypothetical protein
MISSTWRPKAPLARAASPRGVRTKSSRPMPREPSTKPCDGGMT